MLTHLFVTCSEAQPFWSRFNNWWNSKTEDTITLDKNKIVYGVTDNFTRHLALNFCIIIAKYYLYTGFKKRRTVLFRCLLSNIEKHN